MDSCFRADSQLFGEDEDADAGGELDEAEKQGENCEASSMASTSRHFDVLMFSAAEIATLRKEAQAFKSVRAALRSTSADASSSSSASKQAFDKVRVPHPLTFRLAS